MNISAQGFSSEIIDSDEAFDEFVSRCFQQKLKLIVDPILNDEAIIVDGLQIKSLEMLGADNTPEGTPV